LRVFQTHAQISPDGHWLAYVSTESGRSEVFVEDFLPGGTRYQVSTSGGRAPRWRADSRELFFRTVVVDEAAPLLSVSMEPQGRGLRLGVPQKRFQAYAPNPRHDIGFFAYAPTGDGTRFLVTRRPETQVNESSPSGITVVMNWQELLTKK